MAIKKKLQVMMSSKKSTWGTPQWLYDLLDEEFEFGLDACAGKKNAKHAVFITKDQDALKIRWVKLSKGKPAFMNPPYGRKIKHFIQKAYLESDKITTVCLLPGRVDTAYWWDYCIHGEIRFLPGRLHFTEKGERKKEGAPFPNAVVIFGPDIEPCVKWWDVREPRSKKKRRIKK